MQKRSLSDMMYLLIFLFILAFFGGLTLRFAKEKVSLGVLKNHTDLEIWVQENLPERIVWFELFGLYNKSIGKKVILVDGNPVIQLDNNSLVSGGKYADMEYQMEGMCKLEEICEELDIDLLYVNYPGKLKYENDIEELGYHSYSNKNVQYLLRKMNDYGINTLDIRKDFCRKKDYYSWFYRTDHHWTTKSGLLTANIIVEKLNNDFGYQIDKALLNEDQFAYEHYSKCWLGETGRRLSKSYSGLDDFTVIRPRYKTSLIYGDSKGDFSILINENIYKGQNDLYTTSWHYSYLPLGSDAIGIQNNSVKNGKKILLIKDSYSVVVAPFLSLVCEDIYLWDVRYLHESSVIDFIRNNDFDCVMVCYVEDITQREGMFVFDNKEGEAAVMN